MIVPIHLWKITPSESRVMKQILFRSIMLASGLPSQMLWYLLVKKKLDTEIKIHMHHKILPLIIFFFLLLTFSSGISISTTACTTRENIFNYRIRSLSCALKLCCWYKSFPKKVYSTRLLFYWVCGGDKITEICYIHSLKIGGYL